LSGSPVFKVVSEKSPLSFVIETDNEIDNLKPPVDELKHDEKLADFSEPDTESKPKEHVLYSH